MGCFECDCTGTETRYWDKTTGKQTPPKVDTVGGTKPEKQYEAESGTRKSG